MKIPFELNSKQYLISPYTSKQEKDILILKSFEVQDPARYFDILGFTGYEDLSLNEQKVLLWKHREISLGDEVDIKFKCDNCSRMNESVIKCKDFTVPSLRSDDKILKLSKEVTDENLSDFLVGITNEEIDNLDIRQYEALLQIVKDNQIGYDFTKKASCMSCGFEKLFYVGDLDYIYDVMSDESLAGIYKIYSHLTYFGKFTKSDIDDMYPFERTIFIGLLHNLKKELNNA